jgi:putative SOS response-associated peptidase YedK
MCGRARQSPAALNSGFNGILAALQNPGSPPSLATLNMPPNYLNGDNLHPGHELGVFSLDRHSSGSSRLNCKAANWGVIASGTKSNPLPPGASKHFAEQCYNTNTDDNTLAPRFKKLYESGRTAVIPLDGFYEWTADNTVVGSGVPKQPHYIYRHADSAAEFDPASPCTAPLLVAGLYSDVSTGGETPEIIRTFSLLTTHASSDMQSIHVRMPVILTAPEDIAAWLAGPSLGDPNLVERLAATAQRRCTKDDYGLTSHTVSKSINKATNVVENPYFPVAVEKVASVDQFFSKRTKNEDDAASSSSIFKSAAPLKKAKTEAPALFKKVVESTEVTEPAAEQAAAVVAEEEKEEKEEEEEEEEEEAESWACPSCTFLNDAIAPFCGMCEFESPCLTQHSPPAVAQSPAVLASSSAVFKTTKVKSRTPQLKTKVTPKSKNKSITSFFK